MGVLRGVWIASLLAASACTEAPPYIEASTRLASTTDTIGPYTVQSVIVGVTDEDVELSYLVDDDDTFIPVPMREVGDELFIGAIPGRPAGTRISYFVSVWRDGERLLTDPVGAGARPYTFTIQAAE